MSCWEILGRLGLKDLIIYTNSIGCPKCRPKYVAKLKKYYKDKLSSSCDNCNVRYHNNPLRLLDCKEESCKKLAKEAPVILDTLCSECKNHFQELLELLDYFQIRYDLDPRLVRGLDYYSRTVFEIAEASDTERQNSLGGGGRYDDLIEKLGGPKSYAVGYSLGIDRIVNLMKEQKIQPPAKNGIEVCILQLGEKAKNKAKKIYDQISKDSINVLFIPSHESLRTQIKNAVKSKSKYAVIIGQAEAVKDEVILRDLSASAQETLPVKNLASEIRRRLDK
jgi:histidyl-tRNA synthetase